MQCANVLNSHSLVQFLYPQNSMSVERMTTNNHKQGSTSKNGPNQMK